MAMPVVLPLAFTCKLAAVQVLLDLREDTSKAISEYWLRRLETEVFSVVTGDLLCQIIQDFPHKVTSQMFVALVPPHWRCVSLKGCTNVSAVGVQQILEKYEFLQFLTSKI